ncbi:MAG: hypothetical protein RRX93_03105 [Bacteroidales bacterium]
MLFRDIIGQKDLIEKLIGAVQAGRIPHAQLFSGPEGNQKLPLALAYAQYINCKHKLFASDGIDLQGLSSDSCGKCSSCIKFGKLIHPDLHFFYPNNNGSFVKKDSQSIDYISLWRDLTLKKQGEFSYNEWIETMDIGNRQASLNIRDCNTILQTLCLKSFEADFRIVILWMVEKLSASISSVILKTLEEPEPKTVFLLIAENQDQILGTILSRTQIIRVPRIETEDLKNGLIQKGTNETSALNIAASSGGNLIEALCKLSMAGNESLFHEYFADWMRICYKVDMPALLLFSDKISSLGRENLKYFLQECLDEFRGCLLTRNHNETWLKVDAEKQKFWTNFSKYISNKNIPQYYKIINDAIYSIERNAHIPTLFTDASLEFCRLIAAERKRT